MRVGEIDLDTFLNASYLIERGRFGGPDSDVWDEPFPERLSLVVGTAHRTWGEYLTAHGWADRFDDGLAIRWAAHPDALQVMTLHRHEFDGTVSTDTDYREAVRRILSAMPGAYLFQALDGKWKLSVPDADALDDDVIDDDDVIERPSIEYPDTRERLNAATGEFVSVADEYVDATARWPAIGSFQAKNLLDQDGGVELVASGRLYGCGNRHHAASRLATRVLLSRRPVYEWEHVIRGIAYEPGDVLRFGGDVRGLADRRVRVEQVRLNLNNTVTVRAIEFHPVDFDLQVYDAPNLDAPVASAGADMTVAARATVTLDGSGSRDPDGQPLAYEWVQVSGQTVTIRDAAHVRAIFDAPLTGSSAALTFRLTVVDVGGLQDIDEVVITVQAGNVRFVNARGGTVLLGALEGSAEVQVRTITRTAREVRPGTVSLGRLEAIAHVEVLPPTGVPVEARAGTVSLGGLQARVTVQVRTVPRTAREARPGSVALGDLRATATVTVEEASLGPRNDIILLGAFADEFYTYSGGAWDEGVALASTGHNPEGIARDPYGDVIYVDNLFKRFHRYSNGSWDAGTLLRTRGSTRPAWRWIATATCSCSTRPTACSIATARARGIPARPCTRPRSDGRPASPWTRRTATSSSSRRSAHGSTDTRTALGRVVLRSATQARRSARRTASPSTATATCSFSTRPMA